MLDIMRKIQDKSSVLSLGVSLCLIPDVYSQMFIVVRANILLRPSRIVFDIIISMVNMKNICISIGCFLQLFYQVRRFYK